MGLLDEFKDLIAVSDTLMSESGCLWKKEQTFTTLRQYLLEETYEILDAIENQDDHNLLEELGDLLYIIIFLCKIAENDKKFTLEQTIAAVRKKLVHRNQHVFGEVKLTTLEAIREQWRMLKGDEKAHRKTKFEGLPKTMPALAKAQKVAELMKEKKEINIPANEEELGELLFDIAAAAQKKGLNAEFALSQEIARRVQT